MEGDIVAGHQKTLARALLAGEVEDRLVHPLPPHRHPVDIEAEPVGERDAAFAQFDHVARLGEDQRLLQAGRRPLARLDAVGFGGKRRG